MARDGTEINVVKVSVNDFLCEKVNHNAAGNANFNMTKFEIRVIPTFIDYLRSGW